MTIFGIIWILIILYCFFQKDIKYMVFITLFSMVLQCANVFAFENFSVGPQVVTNLIFVIRYFIHKKKIIINKKSSFEKWAFILYIVVIISSLYNGSFSNNLLRILQLGFYIITFSLMSKLSDKIDNNFIYKTIKIITIFVLVMGIVQLISTLGIIPRLSIINYLFYNDYSPNVYYWKDGYDRICSVFMEASYCGCFLVGALFYFLSNWKKGEKNYFIIAFTLIEIILTKSSSAYLSLVACLLLFVLTSKNKKVKRIIVPVSIFLTIILFVFFYNLLDKVIFSKTLSGSALTRNYWNLDAIEAFNNSKIIGVGYKNLRASSLICSLLGEIGLLGTISYVILNFKIGISIFNKKINLNFSSLGVRFGIIAIVITQVIACPDLDFCVYWLFMYFFALYGIKNIEVI